MKIYIPMNAAEDSPIFMPLSTGAYRHVILNEPLDVDESNINESSWGTQGTGGMHAASVLLSRGYVIVSAAARGRNTTTVTGGELNAVGTAPGCVTDLKAAIRYLKYNDEVMPGDADRIIVTGTSGGGAMTSILGTSGNSRYYTPYLEEIGAAMTMPDGKTAVTDDIFAAAAYCPITDLDNANNAYEWLFYGADVPNREGEQGILGAEMARLFVKYINGLGFDPDGDGKALSLDEDSLTGSYKEYLFAAYAEGLTNYMKAQGYVNDKGELSADGTAYMDARLLDEKGNELAYSCRDLFAWEDGKAAARNDMYDEFISIMAAMRTPKAVASFDAGISGGDGSRIGFTGENNVYSTYSNEANGWNHFDLNLGTAVANANTALGREFYTSDKGSFDVSDKVELLAAMYNPMYYIKDYSGVAAAGLKVNKYAGDMLGCGTVAGNWYVRVGTWDRDTTTTVSLNLAMALKVYGVDPDYSIYWNQNHCGWYDNTDLIEWIKGLTK